MNKFVNAVYKILETSCRNSEKISIINSDKFYTETGIKLANIPPLSNICVKEYEFSKSINSLEEVLNSSDKTIYITNVSFLNDDLNTISEKIKYSPKVISLNRLMAIEMKARHRDDLVLTFENGGVRKKSLNIANLDECLRFIIRKKIASKIFNKKEAAELKLESFDLKTKSVFPFRLTNKNNGSYYLIEITTKYNGFLNLKIIKNNYKSYSIKIEHPLISIADLHEFLPSFLKEIDCHDLDGLMVYKYKQLTTKHANGFSLLNLYTNETIKNNEIYFSSYSELNDPFDIDISTSKASGFLPTRNNCVIFSTSRNYENILMWSHYSDAHRGICFGYFPNGIINAVESKKDCNLCIYGDITYQSIRPKSFVYAYRSYISNDLEVLLAQIISLFTKFSDWRYEKEFRFAVFMDNNTGDFSTHTVNVQHSCIFLGSNVKPWWGNFVRKNSWISLIRQLKLSSNKYKLF